MRDSCNWKLKQSVFQQIMAAMSPLEVDLFASRLTKQLPRFYNWRPDPEAARGDGHLHAELGNMSRVCQSPMVPDTSLSYQSEEKTSSKDSTINTSVVNPTMVSTTD